MKIKICGIKTLSDLEISLSYGVDAVGFITDVPIETPRKISLNKASELISKVPIFVTSVLVIMPKNSHEALKMIEVAKPIAVQIHNNLEISELKKIKESNVKLIKTMHISEDTNTNELIEKINALSGIVDAVLLDTAKGGKIGGTGITHNWEISKNVVLNSHIPIILAGGLKPENVKEAIEIVKPYGIDTASGVETDGKKDEKKVIELIKNVRSIHGI